MSMSQSVVPSERNRSRAGADAAELKEAVREFWDAQSCGVALTDADPGTRAFYEEIEAACYQEEYHILLVAEFDEHRGEQVVEIGCGLGTDGRQFVLLRVRQSLRRAIARSWTSDAFGCRGWAPKGHAHAPNRAGQRRRVV